MRPATHRPRANGRSGNSQLLFLIGAVFGFTLAVGLGRLVEPEEDPDIAHYKTVREFAKENFVVEVTERELLDYALHGMLSSLDDYSRYYNEEESAELDRETVGRYTGIGVVLKRPLSEGRVLFPLTGSPAQRAGVRVGDLIVAVDGEDVESSFSTDLLKLDLSAPAKSLSLEVVGLDGERRSLEVRHASLINPTVRHAQIVDEEEGIGYLAITSFSHETPIEFVHSFEFLKTRGMKSLVVDLRANFGGVLTASVDIARRFVSEGVIVSTEGRGEPDRYEALPAMASYEGFPLVVLVDRNSASASEVLAGALQDHRAAVVVGSPTYGKGMVQTIRRFDQVRSTAKVTTSYYYTPSGRNLEHSYDPNRDYGILPDLSVEMSRAERSAVYTHLEQYSPPFEALEALRKWESADDVVLIEPHPSDPQRDAALKLLRGSRPGPYPLEEEG